MDKEMEKVMKGKQRHEERGGRNSERGKKNEERKNGDERKGKTEGD